MKIKTYNGNHIRIIKKTNNGASFNYQGIDMVEAIKNQVKMFQWLELIKIQGLLKELT